MIFKNMADVTFFARSNNDKACTYVLYCRITINGRTKEFSTHEKIDKLSWKQSEQQYKSESDEQSEYINLLINSWKYKIKSTAIALDNGTNELTPLDLYEAAILKQKRSEPTLLQLLNDFLEYEITYSKLEESTVKRHRVYIKNFIAYQAKRKIKFTASNFNLPEAEKFMVWFLEEKNTSNKTTCSRNILFYKKAAQWGIKNGKISKHELLFFIGEKDPVKKVVHLTSIEIKKIIAYEFASATLQKVKDLFLFQCATGVSYCDIYGQWTIEIMNGNKMLVGTRRKTKRYGQRFFIPFDELAEALLLKHNGELPRMIYQKYLPMLKEMIAICGIDKHVSTHVGRKTFATMKNEIGYSTETITKMLGNKSIRTTETHYIADTPVRLINEIDELNMAG